MTGYGSAERTTNRFQVKAEFKSLNGKYLDLSMRLPRCLHSRELQLRKIYGSKFERGTIHFNINLSWVSAGENAIKINRPLAKAYFNELKSLADDLQTNDADIFRTVTTLPDIISQEEEALSDEDYAVVLEACAEAYDALDTYRKEEGSKISGILQSHCSAIVGAIPDIQALDSERTGITKERIQKRLDEFMGEENYDRNRFEQELLYYIEKFDITEEKNRLRANCNLFDEALSQTPKGKKLGFISQEMGREINTLGAKANHAGIQKYVVGMKEELEKIKEQVLNIL